MFAIYHCSFVLSNTANSSGTELLASSTAPLALAVKVQEAIRLRNRRKVFGQPNTLAVTLIMRLSYDFGMWTDSLVRTTATREFTVSGSQRDSRPQRPPFEASPTAAVQHRVRRRETRSTPAVLPTGVLRTLPGVHYIVCFCFYTSNRLLFLVLARRCVSISLCRSLLQHLRVRRIPPVRLASSPGRTFGCLASVLWFPPYTGTLRAASSPSAFSIYMYCFEWYTLVYIVYA